MDEASPRPDRAQTAPTGAGAPTSGAPRPGTQRPGGRTARTRAAVFDAATAELADHGFAGTGIEKVAARAGVSASTVYRRWGTLQRLVHDLVQELTVELREPATGTLEGDLAVVGEAILHLQRDPVHRSWMDAMVAAAVHDPETRAMLATVIGSRIERAAAAVTAAVDRGEAPADTDAHEAIRMVAAPFYYRMYISGDPLDETLPLRAARMVANAVRAGLLPRPAPAPGPDDRDA
ncbi:TetR/AcrR family transcriptional regulator [Streptomyces cocklensis]|uniref:Transcriptional regulator, TetR family n=1 Tax=Actinacidiphila cocklensis TaxID=887465 RepID=A0A9W4DIH9_9ACTN|nr:TetR/AcrR family transcriptional regulator [Actinacidiphila cocklensis]MDD1058581.1 TetR/AcrR family transcriptional regulator [Actinacidiphila cocklensis]CAG6390752.1 Transcriptional regulator, TetR family [Actinacidiphila cocklensis]